MNYFRFLIFTVIIALSINIKAEIQDNDIEQFPEQKIVHKDINVFPEDIPFFDLEGKKHFFDEFDGSAVLIVFWATWINESPELIISLDYLKKDFRKLNFNVIALSEDYQSVDKIREFFDKHEIRHLKIYHDYKNNIYNAMKITTLPSFFLLSADFNNLYQFQGKANWNDEYIRNSLLGFIPGNPEIPKNSFNKTILQFSPEYKAKNSLIQSKNTLPVEKDLSKAEEQDKNTNEINNNEKAK